jgi:hypothetical protein
MARNANVGACWPVARHNIATETDCYAFFKNNLE